MYILVHNSVSVNELDGKKCVYWVAYIVRCNGEGRGQEGMDVNRFGRLYGEGEGENNDEMIKSSVCLC